MKYLDPRERRLLAMGVFLFLISFLLVSGLAQAAPCGKRPDVVEILRKRHGEQPMQIALTANGQVLEIWTNPDGPWTLLVTSPEGFACIQATGHQPWERLPVGDPA